MRNYTGVSWKVSQIRRFLKKKPYMTMTEAADKLDCSREYVRQLKNRFRLPFQQRPKPRCWVCGKSMVGYSKLTAKMPCHRKCSRSHIARSRGFWKRVTLGELDECWKWQGARFPAPYDYGHLCYDRYTHRIAWELTYGPVPDGMQVCHHCDNPPCCNPTHLFLGTQADNMHDRDRKGRNSSRHGRNLKSHCTHGHEYTKENSYYSRTGKRACRECVRVRNRNQLPSFWAAKYRRKKAKEKSDH